MGTGKSQIINGVLKVRIIGIRIHQTPEKADVLDMKGEQIITGPKEGTGKHDRKMRHHFRDRIR